MLTSSSTGLTNQILYRRSEEFLLTGTTLTYGTKTIDNNIPIQQKSHADVLCVNKKLTELTKYVQKNHREFNQILYKTY